MTRTTELKATLVATVGTAQASHGYDARDGAYYAYAEVIDVKPIVRIYLGDERLYLGTIALALGV